MPDSLSSGTTQSWIRLALGTSLALGLLAGCATTTSGTEDGKIGGSKQRDTIRKQAAFLFECPNEKVEIQAISYYPTSSIGTFAVDACGTRAVFHCDNGLECRLQGRSPVETVSNE